MAIPGVCVWVCEGGALPRPRRKGTAGRIRGVGPRISIRGIEEHRSECDNEQHRDKREDAHSLACGLRFGSSSNALSHPLAFDVIAVHAIIEVVGSGGERMDDAPILSFENMVHSPSCGAMT